MSETSPNALIGNCSSPDDTVTPSPEEQLTFFQSPPSLTGDKKSGSCLEEVAQDSPGHCLPAEFEDPVFCDENITLLGRIGRKLASFRGSGYVQVEDGKAKLVDSFPVKVRQLWHFFKRVAGRTVLGDPKPTPFIAVVNEYREVSAMAGLESGLSQLLHDPQKGGWNATPLGEVPKEQVGRIPEVSTIQLTGYRPENPIAPCRDELGPETRTLEALKGTGLVVVGQVPAPTESCGEALQSAATVIPNPPSEGEHTLKFKNGVFVWVEDTKPTLPDLPSGDGCFRLEYCGEGLAWVTKSPELPALPDVSDCEPKCYIPQYCGESITWTPTEETSLSGNLLGNG